jgi:anti-sigma regulatory factor (Ser/Thr protein kinase)
MTTAAAPLTSLITLTLPGTPDSARTARYRTRAALDCRELDGYADDAEAITDELSANAIRHAGAATFGLQVMHMEYVAVAVIVTDPSPQLPVKLDPSGDSERGRGLLIVDALAAAWGWRLRTGGKAVYAILTKEG